MPSFVTVHHSEDPIEAEGRDRLTRTAAHEGLCAERNPEAGQLEHRQIVGAVAHCNRLFGAYAHQLAHLEQHALLLGAIDDVAPGPVE